MSTCQTELHELMYQLDIMFSSKKQEWLQEVEDLQVNMAVDNGCGNEDDEICGWL